MQLTKEQMERAAACESAEEIQALAKSEGIELTDEEAEAYFAELSKVHVSDDELDAVAGGSGSKGLFRSEGMLSDDHPSWVLKG